ncbi:hypothetical protein [Variovorax paradoxus]|uniref:Uncharacterized protein n=1 Tax=Variovorax paradoxus TaxID=34073 RepID=A0A0H2M075_VARPD|nr:hypothetical protein [Variovorax paradoxus]KLN55838.1 hypothetical protein VPARA_28730 [Variovorax paradoxus]
MVLLETFKFVGADRKLSQWLSSTSARTGVGAASGSAAGAAGAFNEAANNSAAGGLRLLVTAGGAPAARYCLTSPACVEAVGTTFLLGITATAAVTLGDINSTVFSGADALDPIDTQPSGGGYGAGRQPVPGGPTYVPTPSQVSKEFGSPPLESPSALQAWLGNVLEGMPLDQAQQWARDFTTTLPAAEQQSMSGLIMASIQANAAAGSQRQKNVTADLQRQYPSASVQNEQYLRDVNGKIVIDPNTGTSRRIDHVVVQNGQVIDSVETTSNTADKRAQLQHEADTRAAGGLYIRDRDTGRLLSVPNVSRLERRP